MAAMTKVLGTVTSVVGEVKATASDGTVRILQVGDKVFSDEVISTSPTGDVRIALEGSGRTLECGNDSNVALSPALLGIGTAIAGQDASPVVAPSVAAQQEMAGPAGKPTAAPADVAALQAAIAAGADPSQVAEATAAGGAPGAGGGESGGGHRPVVIDQGNSTTPVMSGFNTQGGSIDFPNPQINELPPEEGAPVVSVSVQVQVQVEVEDPDNPGSPGDGVVVSGNAASLIEGTNVEAGGKLVNFIITLDKAFDTDVQVTYTIVPGTAETPSDFFDGPLTQTLTIPAGETEIIIPVIIVEDHFVESNETFSIVLVDAVNATINSTANTAVVTIIDDDALPVANPDTNWVREDAFVGEGDAPMASGNVLLTQSHPGDPSAVLSFADAADTDFEPLTVTTTGTFNGTYGTLVLNGDGSYTYTLNNSHPDVQALDDGETLPDTFDYSVTDGFNEESSATLTITIFGTNDGPEIEVRIGNEGPFVDSAVGVVSEAGLSLGSDPESDSEIITGSFQLSDVNGLGDIESVTINGKTVAIGDLVGETFNGSAGVLTITSYDSVAGIANFDYELTQAVTDGEEDETDAFTLTTFDGDDHSAPATITITIVDDVPAAVDDSGTLAEDSVSVGGNVRDNDTQGADRTATVTAGEFEGDLGTLVLSSNGDYTYTLDNSNQAVQSLGVGQTLEENFVYTLTDADGDPSQATLTITITGTNDAPTATANVNTVAEDAVSVSGNMLTDDDGFGLDSDPDAGTVLTVSAVDKTGADQYGTLSFNADGSYTYTLNNEHESVQALGVGGTLTEVYTYTLSDGDGGSDAATLTITITGTNDAPVATANLNTIAEDSVSVSGNMLTDDDGFGLDSDPDAGTVLTVSAVDASGANQYGTLSFNADGSYTYTLNNELEAVQALDAGETLTEVYTYTLSDGDGGSDTASLTITITGTNDAPSITVTSGAEGAVFEAALPFGSDPDSTDETVVGTFQVADADGLDDITHVRINGTSIAIGSLEGSSVNGAHGTLLITDYDGGTGIVTFQYTLTSATTEGLNDSDTFDLSVSDNGGTSFAGPATVTINIVDDIPSLAVSNVVIPNIAGTYEGEYVFEVGADQQSFAASFELDSLLWTNQVDGFEFELVDSTSTTRVYEARATDSDPEDPAFFTITVNSDGTYDFQLITARPVTLEDSGNILTGINGGSNLASFTIPATTFDGFFELVITGHDDDGNATVTISSTELGVDGNTVQEQAGEFLRFDVTPQPGFEDVALSSLGVQVASTGSIKTGDTLQLKIVYTNGDIVTTFSDLGADMSVHFDIDESRIVDYVELAPAENNLVFKITGVELSYVATQFPDDFDLNFSLTGTDADGDSAQANFAVSVKTSESGDFEITGTAGSDHLYGGAGDDILTGQGGNDILTGGGGSDIFNFNSVAEGLDTVTDFSVAGGDRLDVTDVITSTGDAYIILVEDSGNTTVMVNATGTGSPADPGTYTALVTLQGVTGATLEQLLTQINP